MKRTSVTSLITLLILATLACGSLPRLRAPDIGPEPPAPTPLPTPTGPPAPAASLVAPPEVRDVLRAEEAWLNSLYGTASRSVVHITSRAYTYDFFLNPVPQEGTGSGFIWDEAGHVVTNYHVIERAQELEVTLADGTQLAAEVVGADPPNDLAVLRLLDVPAETELVPLPVGASEELHVGQRVVAIGNPFGFDRTLTTGVISALERVIESESGDFIGEVIQTDAAINPGNSGGPLIDIDGRVIGVNTAIFSPTGANAGIGFAIPARTVNRVVPELIEHEVYRHPWLGIESFTLKPALARALQQAGIQVPDEGVLILRVFPEGPADQAGLRGGDRRVRLGNATLPVGGDVITAIDGQPITSRQELTLFLETNRHVGDTVTVRVVRDGTEREVPVTLVARP